MRDGREMAFLFMPDQHDPDSFLREKGMEAMHALLKKPQPLSEMLLDTLERDIDLGTIEGCAKFKEKISVYLKDLNPCVFRSMLIQKVADIMKVPVAELDDMLPAPDHGAGQADNAFKEQQLTAAEPDDPGEPPPWVQEKPGSEQITMRRSTISQSLPRQLLALLLYDPALAYKCQEATMTSLKNWPDEDAMIAPLIYMLEYLAKHADISIYKVYECYSEQYPEHPSVKELLEPIRQLLQNTDDLQQRQSKSTRLFTDVVRSIDKLPDRVRARIRMREAALSGS
jgi:DNA primase